MAISLRECVIALLALAVLLPGQAGAISLGSLEKSTVAEVEEGETAAFTLLFWNRDEQPYPVRLEGQASEGVAVLIEPQEFVLGRQPEGEAEGMTLPGM